ncbi:hypothetical protein BX600DRAFT_503045 [Xylariales sp. PMI_506]|nr:hypothetical protein BX600DRAFT_503045 [Xylariales sp. PMI_506]
MYLEFPHQTRSQTHVCTQNQNTPDAFEFVYFNRPDSIIDGISVHHSRQNMGVKLANKLKHIIGEDAVRMIDVVYRTFILSVQDARKKGVRRKLSPIESEFSGKNDCSWMIRSSVAQHHVKLESGARSVIFASCSPVIRNPHVYGIDLANPTELVAYGRSTKEIADYLKANAVVYQDLSDMNAACMEAATGTSNVQGFEVGVFSGNYVTEVPKGYFEHMRRLRGWKNETSMIATGRFMKQSPEDDRTSTNCTYKGGSESPEPQFHEDISIHNRRGRVGNYRVY